MRRVILWPEATVSELLRTAPLLGPRDSKLSEDTMNLCRDLAWIRAAVESIKAAQRGTAQVDFGELEKRIQGAWELSSAALYHRRHDGDQIRVAGAPVE
jgi:hypothetical protein